MTVREYRPIVWYVASHETQLNILTSVGRKVSTGQGTPSSALAVLCGWEGNRRFDVALAMRHRLLRPLTGSSARWHKKHADNTLLRLTASFTFFCLVLTPHLRITRRPDSEAVPYRPSMHNKVGHNIHTMSVGWFRSIAFQT